MNIYKPKAHWENAISVDKKELELLRDVLVETRLESIKKGKSLRMSKLKLEVFNLENKINKLEGLYKSKLEAYKTFLQSYEKELQDCESNFDDTYKSAKLYMKNFNTEAKNKMEYIISSYEELEDDNKNHIEIKNIVYKDLKSLLALKQKI